MKKKNVLKLFQIYLFPQLVLKTGLISGKKKLAALLEIFKWVLGNTTSSKNQIRKRLIDPGSL